MTFSACATNDNVVPETVPDVDVTDEGVRDGYGGGNNNGAGNTNNGGNTNDGVNGGMNDQDQQLMAESRTKESIKAKSIEVMPLCLILG